MFCLEGQEGDKGRVREERSEGQAGSKKLQSQIGKARRDTSLTLVLALSSPAQGTIFLLKETHPSLLLPHHGEGHGLLKQL